MEGCRSRAISLKPQVTALRAGINMAFIVGWVTNYFYDWTA